MKQFESITKIIDALRSRRLKLVLAESCTGGYIAHLLTSIPGASDYFSGSIVAYSKETKTGILGVDSKIIEEHGTISPQCALAMASGAARAAATDAALSTTGNLGPDPIEGKETGLVYVAVYLRGSARVRELHLTGNRNEIKEMAAEEALKMLLEAIEKQD